MSILYFLSGEVMWSSAISNLFEELGGFYSGSLSLHDEMYESLESGFEEYVCGGIKFLKLALGISK